MTRRLHWSPHGVFLVVMLTASLVATASGSVWVIVQAWRWLTPILLQ